jgi:hypothetical protein
MTPPEALVRRFAADLDELDVGWALVGGCALEAYGVEWPRHDIDIAIDSADEAATAALAEALQRRSHKVWRARHDKLGEVVGVLPRLSKDAAPSGVLIDLLPRACGFEVEMVRAARRMTAMSVELPVARIGHLIAFKIKAMHDLRRARDGRHLRALLELATDEERDLARAALQLCIERGVLRVRDPLAILGPYRLNATLRPT